MKMFSMLLIVSAFHTVLFSQQTGSIIGRVLDKLSNVPLPGATVTIKGTSNSVVTSKEGHFTFQTINSGSIILVISYVGYETIEKSATVPAGNTATVEVSMNLIYKTGDDIVVSASKRAEKITDAPASIQVIGKKELERFTGSNTYEMLSKVHGIEFTRTGVDAVSFNARGLNNAFNIKVFQLVDGRNSMSVHSGNLMMHNNASMVKDDIERIEVVLGPQTALYGPNVHNALINFITKDPRKTQGTTVAVSAGNQQQFSGRFRQATKINSKWAYKLSGEYVSGKDFEFYDSVYAGNQSGRTPIFGPPVVIPERNINFNFRRFRGEAHVYYSLTPKTDIIISTGGANTNSIATHTSGHLQFKGLTYNFLQGRLIHPNFFINLYNSWADFGNSFNVGPYTVDYWNMTHRTPRPLPPDSAEIFAMRYGVRLKEKNQRFNAEAQYNYNFTKAGLLVVAGLSYQKDRPHAYGISLVDSFQRINITQVGVVVQVEDSLPMGLRLIGSARLDHHTNFGSFLSPKLGVVKRIGGGTVRLTWARAYSMPSVLFQYANSAGIFFGNGKGITYIPNKTKMSDNVRKITTPLKPEEVTTVELGYRGTLFEKLNIDVSYFNGLSKNFFNPATTVGGRALLVGDQQVTPFIPGQVGSDDTLRNALFTTVSNFGKVKVYGIDAGLTYTFNSFVSLALKYSWLGSDITKGNPDNDANKDGYVAEDEKSLNSPKNRAVALLSFQNLFKQKFFFDISARYVQQYDFYSGNQISTKAGEGRRGIVQGPNGINYIKNFDWGPLGGFTTIDFSAMYKINSVVTVGMNITNLFDVDQREFAGSPYIRRLIMFEVKVSSPRK